MNKKLLLLFVILLTSVFLRAQMIVPQQYLFYSSDSLQGYDLNACFSEMKTYDARVHLNQDEKNNFMLIREEAFVRTKYQMGGQIFDETAWRAQEIANKNAGPHHGKKLILLPGNTANGGNNKMKSAAHPGNLGMAGCDNLDWEDGNLSNWSGTMGYSTTTALIYYGIAPLSGAPNAQSNFVSAMAGGGSYFGSMNNAENSCSGVTQVNGGNDPRSGVPMVGAGSFSLRLGGENVNLGKNFGPPKCNRGDGSNPFESAGELVQQTIAVTASNCLITYNYNIVLADGGHPAGEQPFFQAGVDDNTGNDILCALYYQECTIGVPPPGYSTAAGKDPIDAAASVFYSNWQSNTVDLTAQIGTTVTLYFFCGGCVPGGHFGYGYIDGHCGPKLLATTGPEVCVGNNTTVNAPPLPVGTVYSWSGPGIVGATTGSTIVANVAGNYTVTWTLPAPNSSCPVSVTAAVAFYANPSITPTSTNPLCSGGSSGTATATASGGSGGYTYAWTGAGYGGGGQGTATATGLTCGVTYTATVTTSDGCPVSKTYSLTCPSAVTSSQVSQTNVLCNGNATGAAKVSANNGTPGYTYTWSPAPGAGQGTTTATGLAGGISYTCTINDANSCPSTQVFNLTQPATAINSSQVGQTNVLCNGGATGTAQVSATNGSPGYTYTWSPAPGGGQGTTTATGLPAGINYTCTIHDLNGCPSSQVFNLTQPATGITSSKIGQTNVLCNGTATGTAQVSASNGSPGYTYTWSPAPGGGQGTSTATGIPAGVNYTCTIHDLNGCPSAQVFNLSQPATAITSSQISHTNILCNGNSTGTAQVSASNGSPGYTYTWSPAPGAGQGTTTATGLPAGINYTCTIHDLNGCPSSQVFNLTQPATAISSSQVSQTNVLCNGSSTGTATVSATNGTPGYTYTWTPAPGGGQGTATATGLPSGISYTCTIHDLNGCPSSQAFTLTQPASALSISSSSSTQTGCGISTGTATVAAAGGAGGFTYTWSPAPGGGQGTTTATGLAAATYTVTVHDVNGCSKTSVYNISAAGGPSALLASSSNANCNTSCNGSASVTASGGAGTYTYAWTPSGGTASSASSLCAGTYTCTIHDKNNCSVTQTVTITAPAVLTAGISSQTNVSCNGGVSGSALVSPAGGTANYTYAWTPSGGTAASAAGLAAGTYTCSITDAKNCTTSQIVTITQPAVLALTPTSTQTGCGTSVGTAKVNVAGGTSAYTYSWSPAPGGGQNTANATGLAAGSYTVHVTDAKGCTQNSVYSITAAGGPTATLFSSSNPLCNASCIGTATVNASGGTGALTYSWSAGAGSSATASALCAGTYSCTITDASNCSTVQSVVIAQPAVLNVNPTQTNISCNGSGTGSATANVSGGTGSYTYVWTSTGGSAATANGLSAGTYTCTINDANNCMTSQVYTLTQPTALSVTPSQTNATCNGSATGTASAAVSGGTGAYTYSWSPAGGSALSASALNAGTYTCTITDANNCPITQVYTLTEPSALTASGTPVSSTCNLSNGSASALAAGGTTGYTYSWTPAGGNADTALGLSSGAYTCTITDLQGCIAKTQITVANTGSKPIAVLIQAGGTSFCAGTTLVLSASGGTSYSWSTGALTDSIQVGAAGIYTVHVTNSCGTDSASVTTSVKPLPNPVITGNNAICAGDSALLQASGGSTYTWSNNTNGSSIYASQSGTYTVIAGNACGSASATATLTVGQVTANFGSDVSKGSKPLPVAFTDSSSTNAVTWTWNFGDGSTGSGQTANHTYPASGTYTVTETVTNAQGCTSTKTEIIVVTDIPSWMTVPNIFTPNDDGRNDVWLIPSAGIDIFNAKVYDRWGVLMAELVAPGEVWDGRTMAGLLASPGTYYYIIHANGDDGKIFDFKGFLELIRQ